MTPKQSAALALADEIVKIRDRCANWTTPGSLGARWADARMGAFQDCARWLDSALSVYRAAPDAPDLERAVLDAAGTAAALLRRGVDLQPTGPTGIALVEAVDALLAARREPDALEAAVDSLFVNGGGQKAERLVLTDKNGRDLGGWCRQAIVDRLREALAERTRRG